MNVKKWAVRRISLIIAGLISLFFFSLSCAQESGEVKLSGVPSTAAVEKPTNSSASQASSRPAEPVKQPARADKPEKIAGQDTPATAAVPASLPAKALLNLDSLTPVIEKPVNKTYGKKLPEQAVKSLAEAQKMLSSKDIPGAIRELDRASGFDPQNPEVRRSLGLAYAALPDFGKAQDNLEIAVKTLPDDFEAQMILGRIASLQKRSDKAIQYLRTALKCTDFKSENPKAAAAYWSLAQMLEKEGFLAASLECMDKLADWIESNGQQYSSESSISDLVVNPEKLLSARGGLLLKLGKYDKAATLLEKAWKRDRSNVTILQMLLDSLISSGRQQQAEQLIVQTAVDKTLGDMIGGLAELLCISSRDKAMPARIWKAYRAKTQPKPAFGAALARAAQRLGAKEDAVGIAKSLIADSPNDAQTVSILAKIYLASGQLDEAFRCLARAIAAHPYDQALAEVVTDMMEIDGSAGMEKRLAEIADTDQSDVKHAMHYLAGVVASNRGNAAVALDQYAKAIKEKDTFYPPYQGKFDLLLVLKKKKEAAEFLEAFEKTSPKGGILPFLKAKLAIANGNVDQAVELLDEARQTETKDLQSLLLLAQIMVMQGREQEAQDILESAVSTKANRDNLDLNRQLFEIYMRQRRFSDAQTVAANLMETWPLQAKLMLVDYYIQRQDKTRAIELLEQIQQQHGQNVQAKLLAVQLANSDFKGLLPKPEYDRTVGLLQQIIGKHPGSVAAKKMLGSIAYQHRDYAVAAKVWQEIFEQSMKLPENVRILGSILIKAEQYKQAVEILQDAVKTYPEDFEFKLQLIGAMKKAKQFAQVDKLIDQWAENDSDESTRDFLLVQKLVCLGMAKEYDKAVKLVEEVLDSNADSFVIRQELLNILVEGGKADKALELVESGLDGKWHSPANQQGFEMFLKHWKIRLLCKAGKIDAAVEFAQDLCKQTPDDLNLRQALVGSLMDADKIDLALKVVDGWLKDLNADGSKRVDDVTEIVEYCWNVAVSLRLTAGKSADALDRINKYLKYASSNSRLNALKSVALTDLGRKKEALAALEKAYAANNMDPTIKNDLSYNYAESNTRLDKAEKLIIEAIAQMKQARQRVFPAEQDTLGWVFYKEGKLSESGAAFNEAIDMLDNESPSTHSVIFDHAGDVMYRLGWTDRAVALWKLACEAGAKEKRQQSDVKLVLELAPKKIKAVESGGQPALALTAREAATRPASMPASKPAESAPAKPESKPADDDDDDNNAPTAGSDVRPAAFYTGD